MPDYSFELDGKTYSFRTDEPLSSAELQAAASQLASPKKPSQNASQGQAQAQKPLPTAPTSRLLPSIPSQQQLVGQVEKSLQPPPVAPGAKKRPVNASTLPAGQLFYTDKTGKRVPATTPAQQALAKNQAKKQTIGTIEKLGAEQGRTITPQKQTLKSSRRFGKTIMREETGAIFPREDTPPNLLERGLEGAGNILATPQGLLKSVALGGISPLPGINIPGMVEFNKYFQNAGFGAGNAMLPEDLASQQAYANLPFLQRANLLKGQDWRTLGMTENTQIRKAEEMKNRPQLDRAFQALGEFATNFGTDPLTLLMGGTNALGKELVANIGAKYGTEAGMKAAAAITKINRATTGAFTAQQAIQGVPEAYRGAVEGDLGKFTKGALGTAFAGLGGLHLLTGEPTTYRPVFDEFTNRSFPATDPLAILGRSEEAIARNERIGGKIFPQPRPKKTEEKPVEPTVPKGKGGGQTPVEPIEAQNMGQQPEPGVATVSPSSATPVAPSPATSVFSPTHNFVTRGETIPVRVLADNGKQARLKVERENGQILTVSRGDLRPIEEGVKPNAVQEQGADESVLRAGQPTVGLPQVGEGNAQPENLTGKGQGEALPQPETVQTSETKIKGGKKSGKGESKQESPVGTGGQVPGVESQTLEGGVGEPGSSGSGSGTGEVRQGEVPKPRSEGKGKSKQGKGEGKSEVPETQLEGVTGARNAIVEPERAQRGMPEVERQEYTTIEDAYNQGKDAIKNRNVDPRAVAAKGAGSIDATKGYQKPQPLTAEDVGVLTYHRAELIKDYNKTSAFLAEAIERGADPKDISALENKLRVIQADFDLNDEGLVRGGREQSAAFNARKMILGNDFSEPGIIRRATVAKGDKLTTEEAAKFKKLAQDIKAQQDKIDAHEGKRNALDAQAVVTEAVEEVKQKRAAGRATKREKLDKEYSALVDELKKSITSPKAVIPGGIPADVVPVLGKMLKNRVEAGINTLDGVIDSLHSELIKHLPDITKDNVRDAIGGYGRERNFTQSDLQKQVNDLKKQALLISKIKAAEAGEVPAKGTPVPKPSAEVQRLRQQLDELLVKQGQKAKATWGAEARQRATVSALERQIADLKARTAKGDYSPQQQKTAVPDTPEIAKLKAELKTAREEYEAKRPATPQQGATGQSTEAKQKAKVKRLEKQIADLEARNAAGDYTPRQKPAPVPPTQEIADLEAKLKSVKEDYEAKRPAADKQAKREANYERKLKSDIENLEQTIASGKFEKPPRKPSPEYSAGIQKLIKDRDILRAKVNYEIENSRPRTFGDWIESYMKSNYLASGKGVLTDLFSTGLEQIVDNAIERPLRAKSGERLGETGYALKGWMRGVTHGVEELVNVLKNGYSQNDAIALNIPTHTEIRGLRYVTRTRAGLNALQFSMAQGAERYAQAYKIAKADKTPGSIRDKVNDLLANPTTEMEMKAANYARDLTFTNDPGKFGSFINVLRQFETPALGEGKLANVKIRPMEIAIPFFNTTYNIARAGMQRTPIGLFRLLDRNIRTDPVLRRQAIVRAVKGTAIMGLAMNLASKGMLTGAAPSDPQARRKYYEQGFQPYSFRVGDNWISYQNAGSLAYPLAMAAGYMERWMHQDKFNTPPDHDIIAAAAQMVKVPLENISLYTVERYLSGDEASIQAAVGGTASGFIPLSAGVRAEATRRDEYQRDLDKWYQFFLAGIPGQREQLPKKLGSNKWPILNKRTGLYNEFSPFPITSAEGTPHSTGKINVNPPNPGEKMMRRINRFTSGVGK